jgi:hypothetical protein
MRLPHSKIACAEVKVVSTPFEVLHRLKPCSQHAVDLFAGEESTGMDTVLIEDTVLVRDHS